MSGFKKFLGVVIVITIIGTAMELFGGPKIEDDTAHIKMNLWYEGAAKNKEWAEKIWDAARHDGVENIVIDCTAEYNDNYGNTEKYTAEIDITDLLSPLSEVRRYTRSKFADEFGDYIVSVVSRRMADTVL